MIRVKSVVLYIASCMFTGIVQAVGKIKSTPTKNAVFCVNVKNFDLPLIKIGDSIAINGVCLTVINTSNDYFEVNVSKETLRCSTFKSSKTGDLVNLEKALRFNQGINGHLVSGHVDGVGEITDKFKEDACIYFKINSPQNLIKYIATKGSICINGVSLTVNYIKNSIFSINIIPHTIATTTLNSLNIGDFVNIEVDIIARYIEKLNTTKHK